MLVRISPATIDRRLAADRAKLALKGRSHIKPGYLLKSQIPIRTWADWDDARPGLVEIDQVGYKGATRSASTPRRDRCPQGTRCRSDGVDCGGHAGTTWICILIHELSLRISSDEYCPPS